MKGNVIEAIIGAAVLAVAGFFVYFAYQNSGEKINHGYMLTARFDDSTGLSSGADVRINGIKVGIVQTLESDQNYMAKATLVIKDDVKIPDNSVAAISTDGIMGAKFISIRPGMSSDILKSGDEIEDTSSSISLESIVNKFIFNMGNKKD